MSFRADNDAYEAWLRNQCQVVEADLEHKHEKMKKDAFTFLRATFFRWAKTIEKICSDLSDAPAVLSVGDTHVENFGTWRDAEGRLVWGVNDFDEAAVIPYPLDLVRLATSVRLAPGVAFSNHDAASAIAAGYRKGLDQPRPTLLDENAAWMLPFVACTDEEREEFWGEVRKYPAAIPPDEVKNALRSSLPTDAVVERFASRRKGSGGLGRRRFVAVADWRGGSVIREAKALAPSAWEWAHGAGGRPPSFLDIATGKYRSPDPFLRVHDGFILRRIAADSRKLDLGDNAGARLNLQLLEAMGFDLGAIHAASEEQTPSIRSDLDARPVDWLHGAAKVAAESVKEDYAAWAKLIPSMIAAFRDFLNVDHNAK
ncbi:hypothetical protein C5688_10020 [Methylocystis sp. MitZ-2018]|nr:hypothetical protein C5688_10020 [Methylocystis sp. MitZ-2018]